MPSSPGRNDKGCAIHERAAQILDLVHEIFPIKGLIVSPDLDRAFEIIRRELPDVTIHEYPSGLECEDWKVPPSWKAVEGYLKDESGRTLASLEDHFLFVAPYSEPVDGWFTKDQIAAHMRTRPDVPNAYSLEHRHAYDYCLVDWGISLPFNVWKSVSDDARFHVHIEIDQEPGIMRVGEYFLPGKRAETICICAHIDELCNDDLSGAMLALELIRGLRKLESREYSYQMLLVPEMMGTLFYAINNRNRVTQTIGMLNLETVGQGENWVLKKALRNGQFLENCLRVALDSCGIPFQEVDFFGGYGNDERIYAWPTIDVPGISLQRFPFREYHTSLDLPDLLSLDLLAEALIICEKFFEVIELNYVPEFVNYTQPWLTRHGLYFDATEDESSFRSFNNLILFNVNGETSVMDLAKISGLSFDVVWKFLECFYEKGLIHKISPQH